MSTKILVGDVRAMLATLPDESVHCVVTSPPYYGLRNYDVEGQIGLEASPREFIATMTDVFREVRRVLRADGTAWVNMGDSYNAAGRNGHGSRDPKFKQSTNRASAQTKDDCRPSAKDLKPKDLMGIPWRLAFALQDDGWYLRQDIIWHKPNPMPESVRDRCTKAHEYIFLLAKSERYYFDQDAAMEPFAQSSIDRLEQPNLEQQEGSDRVPDKTNGKIKACGPSSYRGPSFTRGKTAAVKPSVGQGERVEAIGRNKRSVWTVATQPFKEAHFATFPPALIEPCILAGCPVGGTVLDPFFGAGTTGLVADRHGRNCIGIELNPEYADMARRRIIAESPMFAEVG